MLKIEKSDKLQTTIANAVNLDGLSANDFKDCTAQLLPAPAGQGVVFETPRGTVPAGIDYLNRDEKRHTTSLKKGLACVRTVEHLLSAIHGMGIDNLTVRLNRCGIPFRDFSAEWFAQKLKRDKEFSFEDKKEGRWIKFWPSKTNCLSINVRIDFPQPIGKLQTDYHSEKTDYLRDVCWARSFVASPLDGNGDKWERVRQIFPILPEDPTESPLITYDQNGYLTPLRQQNEPASHKLLDFLGDISLLGYGLSGIIDVYKPGHSFTTNVIDKLKKSLV
jgi:UDP-3-O-[3-hydroxymyristoyl] N-acetylglucosamine deacetylase